MTKTEQIIKVSEDIYLHIYKRFPVAFDHGDGVYLYDAEGKKYLDFGAGIAVMALGYNHKRYNDALKTQIDKLIHTSNLFYHEPGSIAGQKLREASGVPHVLPMPALTRKMQPTGKSGPWRCSIRPGRAISGAWGWARASALRSD